MTPEEIDCFYGWISESDDAQVSACNAQNSFFAVPAGEALEPVNICYSN
jgi:hypothetical protein